MKHPALLSMIFVTTLFGVGVQPLRDNSRSGKEDTPVKNRPPTIESFTSSGADAGLCPWAESSTCRKEVMFWLDVKAIDPDGDPLHYEYSVKEGVIRGSGPVVSWTLPKEGPHTVIVQVTDGRGGKASASVVSVVRSCGTCDGPPCPTVNASCPDTAIEGQRISFTAAVTEIQKVSYRWQVTNGKIIRGQGSPEIQVAVAKWPSKEVTATVTVGGFPASCQRQASCSSKIQSRKP